MKFGVREICDVVLKAKATTVIGNKKFYANEPVIYFDTLKTSSMEGAATTVYAQGGRGNSRLVAWEGERTVTFTMEDALISPEGFMILSGAGLVEASNDKPIYQHMTETIDVSDLKVQNGILMIPTSGKPYLPEDNKVAGDYAYVMFIKDGEIISEPYIPVHGDEITDGLTGNFLCVAKSHDNYNELGQGEGKVAYAADDKYFNTDIIAGSFDSVLIDYYVEHKSAGVQQIEITADKFGGNYYLEASTLFRDQRGVDMPAEFIIPNCKIQSNFTFTMASSGDPSTFTFTMDAFPDYTRFDRSKKVLAAIQIIKTDDEAEDFRKATHHAYTALA